jgi:hypothetical protein
MANEAIAVAIGRQARRGGVCVEGVPEATRVT